MTRIIAGAARGRRLAVPGAGTRPTSDRVREALFSALESEWLGAGRRLVRRCPSSTCSRARGPSASRR